MLDNYLHNHKDWPDLLRILEAEMGILANLIEKDYWIMHVLYGLKQKGFDFELKGGTSLSKGFKIIDRFSEDIDIHIKPSIDQRVEENPKKSKPNHIQSRKDYYDWLAKNIRIDGIIDIERDYAFDDEQYYRSGGIRLYYQSVTSSVAGMKDGILLEVGFDTVTPNKPVSISSWAFDRASKTDGIEIIDNRAIDIPCYHPGYTFVEKLQTIATKFRQEQATGIERPNLMRQYYDVYCLLAHPDVLQFIGSKEYQTHKAARFPKADLEIPLSKNEAYRLSDPKLRARFNQRYKDTAALYYKSQPDFGALLKRLAEYLDRL
jgi:hypothetical protein